MFSEDKAKSIKEANSLVEKESVKCDLAFIKCHLSFLPEAITRLEESGLALTDSLATLDSVKEKINSILASKGNIFQDKMEQVLKKNINLEILQNVAKIQSGVADSIAVGWSLDEVEELKFCPVTSVDVERFFSTYYKHILSNRRHSILEKNLEKIGVFNCFYARGH